MSSTPVPAECKGKARAFANRVTAPSVALELQAASIHEAGRRVAAGRTLRPDAIRDLAAGWTGLPLGSVANEVVWAGRRATMRDCRLYPIQRNNEVWQDPDTYELFLDVLARRLIVSPRFVEYQSLPLVTVQHHALGRRYQRSGVTDDRAILADIQAVFLVASNLIAAAEATGDSAFNVSVPHGLWVGNVALIQVSSGADRLVAHVRTYIDR